MLHLITGGVECLGFVLGWCRVVWVCFVFVREARFAKVGTFGSGRALTGSIESRGMSREKRARALIPIKKTSLLENSRATTQISF